MLTPANIKNHHFQNAGRGFYKIGEVDDYIDQIVASYELVFRENRELIRKLNILASKIEEYRDDEESIRNAIVNAQRMASKLISDAKSEAESILDSAQMRAESADSITNARIKKKVDEVEAQIKDTFDKARLQAKQATDKAENDAKAVITDAKIKASEIIENAASSSRKQLAGIAKDIDSQQIILNKLKEESESFKTTIIKRYEDQIYLIKNISDIAIESINSSHTVREMPAGKSKVDEIIDSLFEEKISSFDKFTSTLGKEIDAEEISKASEIIFEDIYSSSDKSENFEIDYDDQETEDEVSSDDNDEIEDKISEIDEEIENSYMIGDENIDDLLKQFNDGSVTDEVGGFSIRDLTVENYDKTFEFEFVEDE